jgi:N-acylneuraminate cytidylyltransferase
MTIAAIIPARGGSKGIPRKNLLNFAGKPLLYWTVSRAVASNLVDEVYVTSDSDEILDSAVEWGARAVRRPDEIAGDAATSESALLHALDSMNADPEAVVFLQPTSPLRRRDDIDGAIRKFHASEADSLFSGALLEDFIVWHRDDDKIECLNHDWRARKRRQEHTGKSYVENGSIYVFKPEILRRDSNRFGGHIDIFEMELWQSFEIDSLEQLKLCELMFQYYLSEEA